MFFYANYSIVISVTAICKAFPSTECAVWSTWKDGVEFAPFGFTALLYWWSPKTSFSAKASCHLKGWTSEFQRQITVLGWWETPLKPRFFNVNEKCRKMLQIAFLFWVDGSYLLKILSMSMKIARWNSSTSVQWVRETNTSIDFIVVFLPLWISTQHPSLRFLTPAFYR